MWFIGIGCLGWIPQQGDFIQILFFLMLCFAGYLIASLSDIDLRIVIVVAIVARILVVPTFPNLSDDIYRFIWDGRLTQLGVNPYAFLPSRLVNQLPRLDQVLFESLNSPSYFSIYPTIPQITFWLSNMTSSQDLMREAIALKSLHLLFELGSMRLVWLLLKQYELPSRYWLLYALNPLIIIEVLANVHHEGIMMFFLLACLYLLNKKQHALAAIMMALSICTKFLPLMLCPLIFFYLKGRARWVFTMVCAMVTGVVLLPLIIGSGMMTNIGDSAKLYMSSFEFNGSVYYLLRAWGYVIYGFNTIHVVGPVLKALTVLGILGVAYRFGSKANEKDLPLLMMMSFGIFLLLSSTIHPWYIVLMIVLSVFTRYRFALVWSGLIMLTYINYSYNPYHENLWVVLVEYTIVFAILWKEVNAYGLLRKDVEPVVHIPA